MKLLQIHPLFPTVVRLAAVLTPLSLTAGETPVQELAAAIREGDLPKVENAIRDGADVNAFVSEDRNTPDTVLSLATRSNHPRIVESLLKAGADPNKKDGFGNPAVFNAIGKERLETAAALLKSGVSINSLNRDGVTPLLSMAVHGDAGDIAALMSLGADPEVKDPEGNTALGIVANRGEIESMKVLIKNGAKIDVPDSRKPTILTSLLSRFLFPEDQPWRDVIRTLLDAGADINARDENGSNALIIAIRNTRQTPGIVEELLDHSPDLASRDLEGRDALFHAVRRGNLEIAKRLVEMGADFRTTDNEGTDLLMEAAACRSIPMISHFISLGLSPARENQKGSTAIHDACSGWNAFGKNKGDLVEILKILSRNGGSLTKPDHAQETSLHQASDSATKEAVGYLLPHYPDLRIRDGDGNMPLHYAVAAGNAETMALLPLEARDIDDRNADGKTPFILAMECGATGIADKLLGLGADINAMDRSGTSMLMAFVLESDLKGVRYLMENGADPRTIRDAPEHLSRLARLAHDTAAPEEPYAFQISILARASDNPDPRAGDGSTPLMWIAASGNEAALKAILDRKPDLDARSSDGRTALMWAACTRALDLMAALRTAGADGRLRDNTGRTADDWLAWYSEAETAGSVAGGAENDSIPKTLEQARRKALSDYLEMGIRSDEDIAGNPPLHLAASLGDLESTAAILKTGANVDSTSNRGLTPLMEAAANGHLPVVEFLLQQGADASERDSDGQRAIDRSVRFSHAEVSRYLLGLKNSLGADETDLLLALVRERDGPLLLDFLKAGASVPPPGKRINPDGEPINRPSPSQEPLVVAARQETPHMLEILLNRPESSGADHDGLVNLALHFAAEDGRLEACRLLVERGKANPNHMVDDALEGVSTIGVPGAYTSLSRALEGGHFEVVHYLLSQGADVAGRTRGGETPLRFAILGRHREMIRLFLESRGDSLIRLDPGHAESLQLAAAIDDADTILLLLKHGANPAEKAKNGKTALDAAREKDARNAISILESPGE